MFPLFFLLLTGLNASAQFLNLPPRARNALSGTAFTNLITSMSQTTREDTIYTNIVQGNVPDFLRKLVPITTSFTTNGATHTAMYFVTPDYMAVGSDADYFLCPMTPVLAQKLANFLNCALPTRQMVNQIWTNAQVKMNPQPITASPEMTTVPVFAQHNEMVRTQRVTFTSFPLGALTSGDKKDVVIANRIFQQPPPPRVCIYGWHYPDGSYIQPLSTAHDNTWADYSHGIRMVQTFVTVDGIAKTIPEILADPELNGLLSDEGMILTSRYPITASAPVINTPPTDQVATPGGAATFSVVATGTGPLNYQWRFNGTNIANARNSSLTLTNVRPSMAGNYTVFVSNAGGAVSNTAKLNIAIPQIEIKSPAKTNSQFQCRCNGLFGDQYLLEVSTNLTNWSALSILQTTNDPAFFSDTNAVNFSRRFYRAQSTVVQTLADFEWFPNHNEVCFQSPDFSGSTSNLLDLAANTFAAVTNVFPSGHASEKVLQVTWSFKNGASNPWLRFTTFNATNSPNPTLPFNQALLFDIYADNDLYVALGVRETGTTNVAGANGGASGTIEWVGSTTGLPPHGKLVSAGRWTTLQFFLPQEPIRSFTGNGVLSSASGKGTLEHLAFTPAGSALSYNVWLDNFQVAQLGFKGQEF